MAPQGEPVAGRYRLVRALTTGGAGPVWLADDEVLHRRVLIRKCAATAEARALARLGNPHLLTILDVLPGEDGSWIVMENIAARSLLEVVRDRGPLPPVRVAAIGLAVLRALEATSRAGVLHLDVEPARVLLGDGGRIVLSDHCPDGTPGDYAAPERRPDGDPTPAADLWSLGATLSYAVDGCAPRAGDRPRRAGPLTEILAALLRADPAARPLPAEVADGLRRVAEPVVAAPAVASPRAERPMGGGSRRRRWAAGVAGVAVVAVLGATAGSNRDGDRAAAPSTVVASPAGRPSPVLPGHFRWWDDPAGFRVAVPRGWRDRRDPAGALTLTAPGGWPILRISSSAGPARDLFAVLVAEEGRVRVAAYRRIRIEWLPGPGVAVWEYTYAGRSGAEMRCLRRLFATGSRAYAIEWRAPRAQWPRTLPDLDVVLASFGPAG